MPATRLPNVGDPLCEIQNSQQTKVVVEESEYFLALIAVKRKALVNSASF